MFVVGFGQTSTSPQKGAAVVLPPDQNSILSLSKQPVNQSPTGPNGGGGGATVVHLGRPEAIGSTSMQLRWDVRKNPRAIEGFHIHYCIISRSEGEEDEEEVGPDPNCDIHRFPPAIQTVQNGDARTHVLNHLEENTWYRISLRPYYLLTEGAESNHVYAKTQEDGTATYMFILLMGIYLILGSFCGHWQITVDYQNARDTTENVSYDLFFCCHSNTRIKLFFYI